jgi:DNA-directed RNA polymerase specialized sigma24 family protein
MPESERGSNTDRADSRAFVTTHWSVVLTAGQTESAHAKNALETLCRTYWYPLYVFVRRKGYTEEDAEDLTQEYFAQLIAKGHLQQADRNKGKFRTFLLATLDHFLAREWKRAHRQKRGGAFTFVSLDEHSPGDRYRLEPADDHTPESNFLRQWALALLKKTMADLEAECAANGKAALFREARMLLSGERDIGAYTAIGQRLKMGEGAVRVAVHRLRQRFALLIRREIAQTVSNPEEIEEELRFLTSALKA